MMNHSQNDGVGDGSFSTFIGLSRGMRIAYLQGNHQEAYKLAKKALKISNIDVPECMQTGLESDKSRLEKYVEWGESDSGKKHTGVI